MVTDRLSSPSSSEDSIDSDNIDVHDIAQRSENLQPRDRSRSSSPYAPPHGMVPITIKTTGSSFDFEALKRKQGTELWLIRAPIDVS